MNILCVYVLFVVVATVFVDIESRGLEEGVGQLVTFG